MTATATSPTSLRSTLRAAIAARPVTAFLGIAFATTFGLTLLVPFSVAFGLLALFGPALAAIIVARADGTWPELRARITGWRRHAGWYALAFGLPFAVAGTARLIHGALGGGPLGIGTISAIEAVIFVLVIGEEIGWRGFLQPRLRGRMGLAAAGVSVGVAWTLWHLLLYLMPEVRLAEFGVFALWVIPMAVVIGAVAEWARFSVIVATVMHGAANIAAPILLPDVDRTWTLLVTGALYALVAVGIVLASRRWRPSAAAARAGALLAVATLLAACGASAAVPPPTAPPGTVAVEMQDYAFAPTSVEVAPGTTIAFLNTGRAPHTATQAGGFDTGEVKAGEIATITLEMPGSYQFLCTFHPQMTGAITVTEPAAVTPTPAPTPVPSPSATAQSAEPSPSAAPSGEPVAGRFTVPLAQTTPHLVTAEVIDWTGLVTAAESGIPGDGASVPNGTLVITNDDPRTLRLTWSGGPCDATDSVVLDADGRTVTVVSAPCDGDAIAFDRVLVLSLATPVDAATLDARFQPGGDSTG